MVDIHPFIREIERQIAQGFYEEKEGKSIVNPDLSFSLEPGSEGFNLSVTRENAFYRLPDPNIRSLSDLFSLDAKQFFPFRKIMGDLAQMLDYNVPSLLYKEKRDDEGGTGFSPDYKNPLPFEEAVNKYRYAGLIPNNSNRKKIEISFFSPNLDRVQECVGKVVLEVEAGPERLVTLDRCCKYLQSVPGAPKFGQGDSVEVELSGDWIPATVQSYEIIDNEGGTPLRHAYHVQGQTLIFPEEHLRRKG